MIATNCITDASYFTLHEHLPSLEPGRNDKNISRAAGFFPLPPDGWQTGLLPGRKAARQMARPRQASRFMALQGAP
jgi:hypothetical protein